MNRCPITYKKCEGRYSTEGAALLGVKEVRDFPYTQSQQLELALECSDKLSIQGVQPKLSVCLEKGIFKVVQNKG